MKPPQKRVLVLRPDNIGDAVLFSGALRSLRKYWPDARIDLIVKTQVRDLFRLCPHINRVLPLSRLMPWVHVQQHGLRGGWAIERWLLAHPRVFRAWLPKCDVVIYPASAPMECFLRILRIMAAKEKWGFGGLRISMPPWEDDRNRSENVFTRFLENREEDLWVHEVQRTAHFLSFLGIPHDGARPELWASRHDLKRAHARLPDGGGLGFFVGASRTERLWPTHKWIELAARQKVSGRITLFGAQKDQTVSRDIVAGMEGSRSVLDLTGKTTLRELGACLARCEVVVSNDSAGLHMSVAQRIPAVGILGGYHFGRYYPWKDPLGSRVANVDMDCYWCDNHCTFGDYRCVKDVSVDKVLHELEKAFHERSCASANPVS